MNETVGNGSGNDGAVKTVASADGTKIAYQAFGSGAPVILIGGAFNDRTTMLGVAGVLAPRFTGVVYDRRGRGDSDDRSRPGEFAVEREIEDLAALIDRLGGSASLFGHSSGGILALEAVLRGLSVDRVAVYEPPYTPDGARRLPPVDGFDRLKALVQKGDTDGAAALFLEEQTGTPAAVVAEMRAGEGWGYMTAQAHTLPYDVAVCGPGLKIPVDRLGTISAPTLCVNGEKGWDWMQTATRIVADAIPGARHEVLAGEDHGVLHNPEALRAVLTEFLAADHDPRAGDDESA